MSSNHIPRYYEREQPISCKATYSPITKTVAERSNEIIMRRVMELEMQRNPEKARQKREEFLRMTNREDYEFFEELNERKQRKRMEKERQRQMKERREQRAVYADNLRAIINTVMRQSPEIFQLSSQWTVDGTK